MIMDVVHHRLFGPPYKYYTCILVSVNSRNLADSFNKGIDAVNISNIHMNCRLKIWQNTGQYVFMVEDILSLLHPSYLITNVAVLRH
jgi:hypothetical protein